MYLYFKSRDKKINVVFVCNPPFADTRIYTTEIPCFKHCSKFTK